VRQPVLRCGSRPRLRRRWLLRNRLGPEGRPNMLRDIGPEPFVRAHVSGGVAPRRGNGAGNTTRRHSQVAWHACRQDGCRRELPAVRLTPLLHHGEIAEAIARNPAPALLIAGTADRSWPGDRSTNRQADARYRRRGPCLTAARTASGVYRRARHRCHGSREIPTPAAFTRAPPSAGADAGNRKPCSRSAKITSVSMCL
jgi:hypothetical protein